MNPKNRELFDAIFKEMEETSLFTLADKLATVERWLKDAETKGAVPISPKNLMYVPVDDPRVQALIAGEEVALSGLTLGGEETFQSKLVGLSDVQKILILVGVAVLIFIVMGGLIFAVSRKPPEPTATISPPTATVTFTPSPTTGPTAASQLPESYRVVAPGEDRPSTRPNDPVSVEFGGLAFVLAQGKVVNGNLWEPGGGEWLVGTELRRVVAIPYSQEVGQAVQGLSFGDKIKLRLNSGEVVGYHLVEIARIKRHQIEMLSSLSPSLVIVLHGERAGERYALVADAVQGCAGGGVCYTPTPTFVPDVPTPTPTFTPTPTSTATPTLAFAPPLQSAAIFTDTWTVRNAAAGLRLEVVSCTRVAQIGNEKGKFVVCEVTLTAEQDGVSYSGQTLAVTEFSQVENSLDWWPPVTSVAGALGDGRLVARGDSVSGKVAGEVRKGGIGVSSDPVLLWEQAGVRFVIYLE